MQHTLDVLIEAVPYLVGGVGTTLVIVVGGMLLGLVLGMPLAVGQVYGNALVRRAAGLYVWFFRGVPILVLLFLFYYGLFQLIGLNLGAVAAAILVLGMASAAYQSQIFRGSIMALSRGQFRAASALGMSDGQAVCPIILPQALRLSLPAWSNEYSIMLKDSALVFVLGATEIMARAHFVAAREYLHMPLYITAALLYFLLTWAGVRGLRAFERKVAIRGYGRN